MPSGPTTTRYAYAKCDGCGKSNRFEEDQTSRDCERCGHSVSRPERRRKAPDVILPHDPYGSFVS